MKGVMFENGYVRASIELYQLRPGQDARSQGGDIGLESSAGHLDDILPEEDAF